jgi:predicted permease
LLAVWLAPLTIGLLPAGSNLHRLPSPAVTPLVVGFAGALAGLIALGFSLVPLLQARRLNLEATLRDGSRQSGSVAGGAATRWLVSLQVAVALALLITGLLLVSSFRAIQQVDRGMPVAELYSFRLGTRGVAYADPAARIRYFEGVIAQLCKLPHVAAGGAVDFALPTIPASFSGFTQEGDGLFLTDTPKRAVRRYVSVGLLETLGLKMRAGRWLSAHDRADTTPVAVISQSLADKYWPGRDPVGSRVRIDGATDGWVEVVGVVSDLLSHGSQPAVIDSFFLPHAQQAPADTGVFIRTRGGQPLTREQVERAVAAVDPESRAYAHMSVADFFTRSAWQTRFSLTLVGIFAGLAVTLCLTGVYAVLAFAVAGRSSEFGVRMALGANRSDIARLVLRDGLRMTLPGLACGTGLAAVAASGLRHLLFGVGTLDVAAYLLALGGLTLACTAACLVPAARAMRVNPLSALRSD